MRESGGAPTMRQQQQRWELEGRREEEHGVGRQAGERRRERTKWRAGCGPSKSSERTPQAVPAPSPGSRGCGRARPKR